MHVDVSNIPLQNRVQKSQDQLHSGSQCLPLHTVAYTTVCLIIADSYLQCASLVVESYNKSVMHAMASDHHKQLAAFLRAHCIASSYLQDIDRDLHSKIFPPNCRNDNDNDNEGTCKLTAVKALTTLRALIITGIKFSDFSEKR